MTALLLTVALAITPPTVAPTRAQRLAGYITTVYHGADSYALELAERILYEAQAHGIDPALLAAIGHTESWYSLTARGSSGERGLWQILPDLDWRAIPPAERRHWTRHVLVSTWRAAAILAYHLHRCGAQTATCAARYQSGGPRVRRSYVYALRARSRAVRAVLGIP